MSEKSPYPANRDARAEHGLPSGVPASVQQLRDRGMVEVRQYLALRREPFERVLGVDRAADESRPPPFGWDRAFLQERGCHFVRHDNSRSQAIRALFHIEGLAESQQRALRRVVGRADRISREPS